MLPGIRTTLYFWEKSFYVYFWSLFASMDRALLISEHIQEIYFKYLTTDLQFSTLIFQGLHHWFL